MLVRVLDEGNNHPCWPEFFNIHNLGTGLLSRYAYGECMEEGCKGKLLLTVYGEDGDYDIGVVEYCDRIYLIRVDSLEKVEE